MKLLCLKELFIITSAQLKLKGVYWFHLVRLSVCPSVDRIVSALYLLQYSLGQFDICTSHQATSEGVSNVKFCSKSKTNGSFDKFFELVTLTSSCFDLGSNMNWSIVWIIIGRRGYPLNAGVLVVLVIIYSIIILWYYKIWYDVMWCGVVWCDVMWYDTIWDTIKCDVMWCDVMWRDVMWWDVMYLPFETYYNCRAAREMPYTRCVRYTH